MAKETFYNPWGPGSDGYDRWMKPNPWEGGGEQAPKSDKVDLPQQGSINVALFPKGINRAGKDDAVYWFHKTLKMSNNDPSGMNGWKIVYVKGINDADEKLSQLNIKNLFIGSHGEYGSSEFDIGYETVGDRDDLRALNQIRARNIILGACFIGNPAFKIGNMPIGESIMRELGGRCGADVYGNMGYTYPGIPAAGDNMWNDSSQIEFVPSGIDTIYSYQKEEYKYMLDGAGRWSKVDTFGIASEVQTLFLTNDGQFGLLNGAIGVNNAWRSQNHVKLAIEDVKNDQARLPSGFGSDLIPDSGGRIIE